MDMQSVGGDTLQSAQARLTELQEFIAAKERDIQYERDAYNARREAARNRSMSKAEFNALYPVAPVDADFVEENAPIAAKNAEHDALVAELMADTSKRDRINPQIQHLEQEVFALEASKKIVIDGYYAIQANPHRSLTDTEFLTLYPGPVEDDFATETAAIAEARTAANKLNAFFKSGTYPRPGLYDVDLLTGTGVDWIAA